MSPPSIKMRERGVMLNISYPWPWHTMTGFAKFGYRGGELPQTEALAEQIFSLPMYPTLTDSEQARVCEGLRAALNG